MAKKPADIQREIDDLRRSLDDKLDRVQGRVRDDVDQFSSNTWEELRERTRIDEYVEKRPMTTVAGAFGVGVLLGILSEGVSMGGGGQENDAQRRMQQRRNGRSQSQGGGIVNNMVGTASGVLSGKLGDELQQLLRQVLGEDQPRERAGAVRDEGPERHKGGNGYAQSDREYEYESGH